MESTGEIQESPIARPRKSHATEPDAIAFKHAQKPMSANTWGNKYHICNSAYTDGTKYIW